MSWQDRPYFAVIKSIVAAAYTRPANAAKGHRGPRQADGAVALMEALESRLLLDSALGATVGALAGSDAAQATGQLTFVQEVTQGLNKPASIAFSPDGKTAYVTARDANGVFVFQRNPVTGTLVYLQMVEAKDAEGIAISPDGNFLYVTGNDADPDDPNLTILKRDPDPLALGRLDPTPVATVFDDANTFLIGATDVVVSPNDDAMHVYVTSVGEDGITVFTRNANGSLSHTTGASSKDVKDGVNGVEGIERPTDIEISSDGLYVYVAGRDDHAVAVFARNPVDGRLTWLEAEKHGQNDPTDAGPSVTGMSDPVSLALSPDGLNLYVGNKGGTVAVFARDTQTGKLSFITSYKDGVSGVDGIAWASGIVVSPDGQHVYVASRGDQAVGMATRNADGTLTWHEPQPDHLAAQDRDVWAVAAGPPDGRQVYALGDSTVAGADAVVVFDRDGDFAPLGAISGVKYHDLNRNGTLDPGEPPLRDWTIYLDENGNGQFDEPPGGGVNQLDYTFGSKGTNQTKPLQVGGVLGNIESVQLRVIADFNVLGMTLISPLGTAVMRTNTFGQLTATTEYDGESANGTWTMTVSGTKFGSGTDPILDSATLTITTDDAIVLERSVKTDENGVYTFGSLLPGDYIVREVNPDPTLWQQLEPASGQHEITLDAQQQVFPDINFGNARQGLTITYNGQEVGNSNSDSPLLLTGQLFYGQDALFDLTLTNTGSTALTLGEFDSPDPDTVPGGMTGWYFVNPTTGGRLDLGDGAPFPDPLDPGESVVIQFRFLTEVVGANYGAPGTVEDNSGRQPRTPFATGFPVPERDSFELDNDPGASRTIATDGTPQEHTIDRLLVAGTSPPTLGPDQDWVHFTLDEPTYVTVEASVPDLSQTLAGIAAAVYVYGPLNSSADVVPRTMTLSGGTPANLVVTVTGGNELGNAFGANGQPGTFAGRLMAGTYYVSANEASFALRLRDELGDDVGMLSVNDQETVTRYLPTYTLAVAAGGLDVDGNGLADALTDGILTMRYLSGFTGSTLLTDALGAGATRGASEQVSAFLDASKNVMLDVDGNGLADALTDGVLLVRYLFGFTGTALVANVLGPGATRTDPQAIVDYLAVMLPDTTIAPMAAAPASWNAAEVKDLPISASAAIGLRASASAVLWEARFKPMVYETPLPDWSLKTDMTRHRWLEASL